MPRGIPGSGPNAGRKKQKRGKREVIHELPPISTGEKPQQFTTEVASLSPQQVDALVNYHVNRLEKIIREATTEREKWLVFQAPSQNTQHTPATEFAHGGSR